MHREKTIAIMQPYFLPYIGYWQLLNVVDTFVIYDEIQFSKKGWINRNRFLMNGKDTLFSLPLKKGSDYCNVNQRFLSGQFVKEREKILRKFEGAYKKAPYFNEGYELLKKCLLNDLLNLFEFIYHSINVIKESLKINTKIEISSSINFDKSLTGKNKVIAICKALNAKKYINPIGGVELYKKDEFKNINVELSFLESHKIEYQQFKNPFIHCLSIIDVIMFNGIENTISLLDKMESC